MAESQRDRRKRARADDPERRGRRTGPRAEIILPATIDAIGGLQHINLLDISQDGACLSGPRLPGEGKDVILKCGAIDAFGTVVWAAGEKCGVLFDETLGATDLIELRQIADAYGQSANSLEQRQAAADWLNGLAR